LNPYLITLNHLQRTYDCPAHRHRRENATTWEGSQELGQRCDVGKHDV